MMERSAKTRLPGIAPLKRQPLKKSIPACQTGSFQRYQAHQTSAQPTVGFRQENKSEISDEKLLELYEVTPHLLGEEFMRGYSNARVGVNAVSPYVIGGCVAAGLSVVSPLPVAFGAATVVAPLVSGYIRYLRSLYKGEIATCDKARELKSAEFKRLEEETTLSLKSLKRCRDDLEDHFGYGLNENNLKRMKLENERNQDNGAEQASRYEGLIQKACFNASAENECTDEAPDGSEETQIEIRKFEEQQKLHLRRYRNAEDMDVKIRAVPGLISELGALNKKMISCGESLERLDQDRKRLLLIKSRK